MKVFIKRSLFVTTRPYHKVVIYNHDRTICTNELIVLNPMKGELRHLVDESRKLFKWQSDNQMNHQK
jgi:hypothetical protein